MKATKATQIIIPKVNVTIDVWNVSGKKPRLIRREQRGNLAVLTGRNLLRDFLAGDAVTGLERFAVGTDGTTVTANDTQLGVEVFRDQLTKITKDVAKLTVQYYLSSISANGNTLQEAGLFGNGATDTANSGTMYARVTHSAIEKTSSTAVTYTWDLTWEVT